MGATAPMRAHLSPSTVFHYTSQMDYFTHHPQLCMISISFQVDLFLQKNWFFVEMEPP